MTGMISRVAGAGTLVLALLVSGCSKKEEGMSAQPAGAAAAPAPGTPAEQAPVGQPGSAERPAPRPGDGNSASAARPGSGPVGSQPSGSRPEPAARGFGDSAVPPKRVDAPPPPAPRQFTLAAGTPISVRTVSAISTKTAVSGDRFEGTMAQDLVVDGYVVAPKGSTVVGQVSESDPGGRVKGVASLAVTLSRITDQSGAPINVNTPAVSRVAQSSKKKDALKVGIGAGIGAAIGAIAGGGKGAAIGAGAGGAAGTGMVLATHGDAAVIPSETVLTFRLSSPVNVTEKK